MERMKKREKKGMKSTGKGERRGKTWNKDKETGMEEKRRGEGRGGK